MTQVEYQRSRGRRLTYRIAADENGAFAVYLADKELMRGSDALVAGGPHRGPNKRKAVGAIEEAKRAIENLALMDEF
jgi:hypothetical protein